MTVIWDFRTGEGGGGQSNDGVRMVIWNKHVISLTRLIEKLTFVDFLDVPGSFIVGQISDLLLPPPFFVQHLVLEKVGRLFITLRGS